MGNQTFAAHMLEREARSWRDLTSAEYDRAICGMLDNIDRTPDPADRSNALMVLASSSLQRRNPSLIESRARFAEQLLASITTDGDSKHGRVYLLILLAWLHLGTVAAQGPASISRVPDLPPGAALPYGADATAIADPLLREQARVLAQSHAVAVERWNAKQRAIEHLSRIAALVRAVQLDFNQEQEALRELQLAMSLAPGLPPSLRKLLENDSS